MPESVNAVRFVLRARRGPVGGAAMVVLSRNVVHAAFWLLEVMMAVAGCSCCCPRGFLALVQVMVYAGAVSVLVLFTVMLTLRRREDAIRPLDLSWSARASPWCSRGVLFAIGGFEVPAHRVPASRPASRRSAAPCSPSWALPFEIASVVLLIALVGAVWWSREGDE